LIWLSFSYPSKNYDKYNSGAGIGLVLIKTLEKVFRSRRDWDKCEIDINNDGKNYDIIKLLSALYMLSYQKFSILFKDIRLNSQKNTSIDRIVFRAILTLPC